MTGPDYFSALFANFHFLRPLWLLALIPAILLVSYLWRINESASSWDRAIDKELLPFLLDTTKSVAERTPLVLLLTLWTLAIIALAGPVWEKISQPVQQRQDALVIVYDQSLSMYATDYEPNRLTVSKRKLLDALDLRSEGQTGLIVYAGEAHTVTPLTEDSVTIKALVPALSPNIMPSFGSNVVRAISLAKSLLLDAGATSGTILLITDGIERSEHSELVGLLNQSGYLLSILGVGTEAGAPIPAAGGDFLRDSGGRIIVPVLDRANLQDLAASVSGRYMDLQLTGGDLAYLLAEDTFFREEDLTGVDENFDIWYEVGPWFLLLILPLSALIFRRGWILSATITMAIFSTLTPGGDVQAAEWTDLWKTKDQQAADAYANEDPATAAALFRTPAWRGAAAYHSGDYATAIQAYSEKPGFDPDAHYNLGNAYARANSLEEAIASYDVAIGLQPDHADAIHNREIVMALLEQQRQEEAEDQEDSMSDEQEQQEAAQTEPEENQSEPEQQEEQEEQDQSGDQEEQQESEPQDGEQQQTEEQDQGEQPQMSNAEIESQESLEQWLRRIEDDPGELLQRKFQFEYRRRQIESRNTNQSAETKIW
ncbi:MAG: VWA domain-containing protein [Gammaproteobacteria bacterium]|nr:VWA domain-containing protein [Gammaproteobacteria bacterium]MDP2139211.1 VWA domain-containing protein [Gammaproteobacteria bacterium]MDP2349020.1 VWA domain-containing protein [Gammaproteobacteria bacterium]